MKRKTIFLMCLLLGALSLHAQAWQGQGDQKVQVGANLWGRGSFGVKAVYDYGIADAISIGAGAAFYSSGTSDNDNSAFSIFGRADYHLQEVLRLPDNMDIYPGISMGVFGDAFDFGIHFGFRYLFNDKIGAYAEIGNRGGLGVVFNL